MTKTRMRTRTRTSIAPACCSGPCPSHAEIDQALVYSVDCLAEARHLRETLTWRPGDPTLLAVPAG